MATISDEIFNLIFWPFVLGKDVNESLKDVKPLIVIALLIELALWLATIAFIPAVLIWSYANDKYSNSVKNYIIKGTILLFALAAFALAIYFAPAIMALFELYSIYATVKLIMLAYVAVPLACACIGACGGGLISTSVVKASEAVFASVQSCTEEVSKPKGYSPVLESNHLNIAQTPKSWNQVVYPENQPESSGDAPQHDCRNHRAHPCL